MPRAAARRLAERLDIRGALLRAMGAGKVSLGGSFIAEPPWAQEGFALLLHFAPLSCWAWVWIVCGTITFCSAWLPFPRDRFGFLAASTPPALWAFAYGWAAAFGGYPRGWWLFAWFICSHCIVIGVCSRIPPRRSQVLNPRGQEGGPG